MGNGTMSHFHVSKDKDQAGSILSFHYNLHLAVGAPGLEPEEERARQ